MAKNHPTDFTYHTPKCPRCGSTNWQTQELAYGQSVRQTEGGYRSISQFGESIAPPERRSLIAGPLASAAGLGGGTLLFLPTLMGKQLVDEGLSTPIFEPQVYVPALVVGATVFAVGFFAAIRYNALQWPSKYADWQNVRICRRCGCKSTASVATNDLLPRNQP